MPLSLNEIKDRALAFSRDWEGERAEKAEAQTFWNEFFNVFGVSRKRLASFEEPVRRAHSRYKEKGGKSGFIDLLWRGTLIAEHKSLGRDLDSAYKQALDKAVDAAYAGAGFKPAPTKSDAERVAFLFELYHKYTSMLPAPEATKLRKRK